MRCVPNPTRPGALRPVETITDRAKRYRAAAVRNATRKGKPRCFYCGSSRGQIVTDHVDGNEANTNPANLVDACKACNTRKGAAFAAAGIGKRTNQRNPEPAARGAANKYQWVLAVSSIARRNRRTGRLERSTEGGWKQRLMDPKEAARMIAATPPEKRREWNAEIRAKRQPTQGMLDWDSILNEYGS